MGCGGFRHRLQGCNPGPSISRGLREDICQEIDTGSNIIGGLSILSAQGPTVLIAQESLLSKSSTGHGQHTRDLNLSLQVVPQPCWRRQTVSISTCIGRWWCHDRLTSDVSAASTIVFCINFVLCFCSLLSLSASKYQLIKSMGLLSFMVHQGHLQPGETPNQWWFLFSSVRAVYDWAVQYNVSWIYPVILWCNPVICLCN